MGNRFLINRDTDTVANALQDTAGGMMDIISSNRKRRADKTFRERQLDETIRSNKEADSLARDKFKHHVAKDQLHPAERIPTQVDVEKFSASIAGVERASGLEKGLLTKKAGIFVNQMRKYAKEGYTKAQMERMLRPDMEVYTRELITDLSNRLHNATYENEHDKVEQYTKLLEGLENDPEAISKIFFPNARTFNDDQDRAAAEKAWVHM